MPPIQTYFMQKGSNFITKNSQIRKILSFNQKRCRNLAILTYVVLKHHAKSITPQGTADHGADVPVVTSVGGIGFRISPFEVYKTLWGKVTAEKSLSGGSLIFKLTEQAA